MNTTLSLIVNCAKQSTMFEYWQPKHQPRIVLFLRFLLEGIANTLTINYSKEGLK